MYTTITDSRQFKIFSAAAFAALMMIMLAAAFATGATQAQGLDDTPTATATPTPQPCGPGEAKAFQPEPHEITEGNFALFDAYWRSTSSSGPTGGTGTPGTETPSAAPNSGVLHTNLCPPKMVTTEQDDGFGTITEITERSVSNIDIGEAIMHVLDKHKVDVVATNAEATAGQLSLEEYPEVRGGLGLEDDDPVPDGTKVWWLPLDDPDTTKDETSELSLGFSTALLDSDDWLTRSDGNPLRYKFDVLRNPADPFEDPHFFAYEAPKAEGTKAELVWDSFSPGDERDDVLMDPGEYRALQWIFTKPGTYLLSVHLQGFVRKDNPYGEHDIEYDQDWKPISENETETSEVKDYSIQVGDTLEEMEPPLFGANLSVLENSPGGVKVGSPIPIYESEDTAKLRYALSGVGRSNFKAVAATDPYGAPHAVQIMVADGANLDYETKSSYELVLSVTDGVDHENNQDDRVDDTLAIRIGLEDQDAGLYLEPDTTIPLAGETVNFIAWYEPTPERRGQDVFLYQWAQQVTIDGELKWHAIAPSEAPSVPSWSVSSSAGTKTFRVSVALMNENDNNGIPTTWVRSNHVSIHWRLN